MSIEKIVLIIFCITADLLWAKTIWGGWAEETYEKFQHDSKVWFWLYWLNIPTTPENCIKFLKIISGIGMAFVTLLTILILL
jgi:hypothetical protein